MKGGWHGNQASHAQLRAAGQAPAPARHNFVCSKRSRCDQVRCQCAAWGPSSNGDSALKAFAATASEGETDLDLDGGTFQTKCQRLPNERLTCCLPLQAEGSDAHARLSALPSHLSCSESCCCARAPSSGIAVPCCCGAAPDRRAQMPARKFLQLCLMACISERVC